MWEQVKLTMSLLKTEAAHMPAGVCIQWSWQALWEAGEIHSWRNLSTDRINVDNKKVDKRSLWWITGV